MEVDYSHGNEKQTGVEIVRDGAPLGQTGAGDAPKGRKPNPKVVKPFRKTMFRLFDHGLTRLLWAEGSLSLLAPELNFYCL